MGEHFSCTNKNSGVLPGDTQGLVCVFGQFKAYIAGDQGMARLSSAMAYAGTPDSIGRVFSSRERLVRSITALDVSAEQIVDLTWSCQDGGSLLCSCVPKFKVGRVLDCQGNRFDECLFIPLTVEQLEKFKTNGARI